MRDELEDNGGQLGKPAELIEPGPASSFPSQSDNSDLDWGDDDGPVQSPRAVFTADSPLVQALQRLHFDIEELSTLRNYRAGHALSSQGKAQPPF